MTSTRVRRTQAERTAKTRQALLDATLQSLIELGYRGTTTTEVARRAGVSLGALLHHFPTKADLVVAAERHATDRRLEEYRQAMTGLDTAGDDKLDASIDLLWSMMTGPAFLVGVELTVASRTDPELAAAFVEDDRRFMAACKQMYVDLWALDDGTPGLPEVGFHLVWAQLEGLALSRMINGYEWHPTEEVLNAFKAVIRLTVTTLQQDGQLTPKEE